MIRLRCGVGKRQVSGDHCLVEVVVKRPKHIFGVAEVVDGEALVFPFYEHVVDDRGVRRVESQ